MARQIGDGLSSRILLDESGTTITRVAKSATVAWSHEVMFRVLPPLACHLPVTIPEPTAITPATPVQPYGALIYPFLAGRTATIDDLTPNIARQIATILGSLHHISWSALGLAAPYLPAQDESRWLELRSFIDATCQKMLSARERLALESWWSRFLSAPERQVFNPAICHGDLWHENILLDTSGTRIAAILDWENVTWGDPAQDFAPLAHAGRPFANDVMRAYAGMQRGRVEIDQAFRRRVQWFWEAREFSGLRIAIEQKDEEELEEAIHKIRNGPILSGRDMA